MPHCTHPLTIILLYIYIYIYIHIYIYTQPPPYKNQCSWGGGEHFLFYPCRIASWRPGPSGADARGAGARSAGTGPS